MKLMMFIVCVLCLVSPTTAAIFSVAGTVTEKVTEVDYPFVVVTSGGNDIAVSCDELCECVHDDDIVAITGYIGSPGEACSGRELFYNPLVASQVIVLASDWLNCVTIESK
jgi:hypothetical protein